MGRLQGWVLETVLVIFQVVLAFTPQPFSALLCSALEQSFVYRLWVPGPLVSWLLARFISGEHWQETSQ